MAGSKKTADKSQISKLHPIEALGNAPAREGEIRVERLEKRLAPKVPFPHKHGFYHFVYIEAGSGWHEIDFVRYSIRAGQLFLVKPGQVHAWNLSSRTRGYVLEFTRSSLANSKQSERIWQSLQQSPSMAEDDSSAEFLNLMCQEFAKAAPGFRAILEHLLFALLIQLDRRQAGTKGKGGLEFIEKFSALVEEHFQKQHSVEFYAELLSVKPKVLTTKVSKALGKSAGAFIQERCLAEAKRLLAYSDLAIAEIAYNLGYEDPNYFARFFKQREGTTPGRFRKLASHTVPH